MAIQLFNGTMKFWDSNVIYISPNVICEWKTSANRTASLKIKKCKGVMKISHNFIITDITSNQVRSILNDAGDYIVNIGDLSSIAKYERIKIGL